MLAEIFLNIALLEKCAVTDRNDMFRSKYAVDEREA